MRLRSIIFYTWKVIFDESSGNVQGQAVIKNPQKLSKLFHIPHLSKLSFLIKWKFMNNILKARGLFIKWRRKIDEWNILANNGIEIYMSCILFLKRKREVSRRHVSPRIHKRFRTPTLDNNYTSDTYRFYEIERFVLEVVRIIVVSRN